MKPVLYLIAVATALASCGGSGSGNETTKAGADSFNVSNVRLAIEVVNRKMVDAALKGDSAGIATLYHSDAKVYPPNMAGTTRNIGASMLAGVPKMGIKTFSLNTSDVTGDAEQVVETGSYEMGDGFKPLDRGKYIVVWKQENGDWKLWRDIWNSDMPAAPAKTK